MPDVWRDLSLIIRPNGSGFRLEAYDGLPPNGLSSNGLPLGIETRPWPDAKRLAEARRQLSLHEPCPAAVGELGDLAGEWLLAGSIGRAVAKELAALGSDTATGLRLRICCDVEGLRTFTDPYYRHILWEALRLPGWVASKGREPSRLLSPYLASNGCVSVVRQPLADGSRGLQAAPAPLEGPIRILLVYANSKTGPLERLDELVGSIRHALEPLSRDGLVECPPQWILRDPTPGQVLDVHRSVDPHVLVTLCHGAQVNGRQGNGRQGNGRQGNGTPAAPVDCCLTLSDGQGGEAYLHGGDLAELLQTTEAPSLRLVVMPHCETAAAAPGLLYAGVPAVIGMSAPIADGLPTSHLVDQLFRSLTSFKSLDECLIDVRHRLIGAFGEDNPHWCIPTLWLAGVDNRPFVSPKAIRTSTYLGRVLSQHGTIEPIGQGPVPLERHRVEVGVQREAPREMAPDPIGPAEPRSRPRHGRAGSLRDRSIAEHLAAQARAERKLEQVDLRAALRTPAPGRNRFYLQGPPGSGKSTLLRHLAVEAAAAAKSSGSRFPLLVRLSELSAALLHGLGDVDGALLEFLVRQLDPLPDPGGLLQAGRVLLLCDALDEVPAQVEERPGRAVALRELACEALGRFAAKHGSCPIIVTSRLCVRPAKLQGFQDLELQSLDDAGISAYVAAYFTHFPGPAADAGRNSADDQQQFLQALNQNSHLRALARTPLFLSLICYVYRLDGLPLPARQTALFDAATRHLLEGPGRVATPFHPRVRRRVLEAIALAATCLGARETEFAESRFEEAAHRALTSLRPWHAELSLSPVLTDLLENSGLLQPTAEGGFRFLHLSLQEYFAASALASPGTLAALRVAGPEALDYVLAKSWDPDWELFTLFYTGSAPDPAALLERLADRRKDSAFHHRLALAACCLPEALPALGCAHPLVARIRGAVLSRLWKRAIVFRRSGETILERTLPALASVRDTQPPGSGRPTRFTLQVRRMLQDWRRERHELAVEALIRVGVAAATPEILAALTALVRDANARLRSPVEKVLDVLDKLGEATPEIRDARIAVFRPGRAVRMRAPAAEALGKLGGATPEILATLTALLRDGGSWDRTSAAEALGRLGKATPEIRDALTARLRDANGGVRRSAVEALGKLGGATPEILATLTALLRDGHSWDRKSAAEALGRLGKATPEILAALAALLRDRDDLVRISAVEALGRLGKATPESLATLTALLRDRDELVRIRAAEALALGRLGKATPEIRDALTALLRDRDKRVRMTAVGALNELGAATQEGLAPLRAMLRDENKWVRIPAARALGKAEGATPEILAALTARLRDRDALVRECATNALGDLGGATPEILAALTARLRDRDERVRMTAAYALETIQGNEDRLFHTWRGWRAREVAELSAAQIRLR